MKNLEGNTLFLQDCKHDNNKNLEAVNMANGRQLKADIFTFLMDKHFKAETLHLLTFNNLKILAREYGFKC